MANRVTVPVTNFETLNPPWSLQSLDQDLVALQAALNDASLGYVTTGTDTGTVNNYVITTPAYGMPSAYNPGMTVFLVPASTNTGASTLTVGSLGSTPITDASGNPLPSGALVANQGVWMTYSGTSFMVASIFTSQITAVRLRSFNAIGNPTFEVDQRNVGNNIALGTGGQTPMICDRWAVFKNGTMTLNAQSATGGPIVIPGTNFAITERYFTVTLTSQEVSLAAGDYVEIIQYIEGPMLRELVSDVHSVSLLVSSNVANLKFALALNDPANNRSLCKLCTLGAGGGWTLITLPNLPAFQGGATIAPAAVGYSLRIGLAVGSTYMPPSNDVWNAGTYFGAIGMDNFASKPVSSTFSLAFVQHEPGPVCTTLMDKPYSQNYDECLRYYQKSYDYGIIVGTATSPGMASFFQNVASTVGYGSVRFHKPLAKFAPTITLYDHNNGAVNSVMDGFGVHHTGATATGGTTGIYQINFTTATTAITPVWAHWTVDTGW
jgi:hypothetical protein